MTTTPYTVTSSQHEFINILRSVPTLLTKNKRYKDMITIAVLREFAHEAGYSSVPAWCTSNDRLVGSRGSGVYKVPELWADDSELNVRQENRGRKPNRKPIVLQENTAMESDPVSPSNDDVSDTVGSDTVELARTISNGESESFTPSVDENYVPWGYHNEIKSIIKSRRFCPVFITGLSGNGKTTMVEQACASLKRECIRVNFTAATDEDELLGGFRLIGGETKFVPGPVLVAMERGAVLLLDEIDLGGHLIMCLQSVLEGKGKFIPKIGKYVRPAPGFTVMATANTKGKGSEDGRFAGTNILNEAFLDRFAFTYEQDYADTKVEKRILSKFAESLSVKDEAFLDALVAWADIIRKSFKQQVVNELITTRRLRDIIFAYSVFGNKMTAIERCVSRFDQTTKDSFMQFYTKVDADANPPAVQEEASVQTNVQTNTNAPVPF